MKPQLPSTISPVILVLGALLVGTAACAATTPGKTASGNCRVVMKDYTVVATTGTSTHTTAGHCDFEQATTSLHCSLQSRDMRGNSSTATSISSFHSLDDFIDEVRVVPPLMKSLSITTTQHVGNMSVAGKESHAYDTQGRLLRIVRNGAQGTAVTTNASSWDAAGRPRVTQTTMQGGNARLDIDFNDGTRTSTTRVNGGESVTIETFDADGNPIKSVIRSGKYASTRLYQISATQRICRS